MDHLQTRLEALEQQMHTVNHRLRWWRGLACGLLALAVLTWALPAGTATDEAATGGEKGLAHRVAALESLLKHFSRKGDDIFITKANLHLVNGLGRTDCGNPDNPIPGCLNGLGNLIVGYNELRGFEDIRTGSHNVVVGSGHNFSSTGGLVVGGSNTISRPGAVVSGGFSNTARGDLAVVSGGRNRTAEGEFDWVAGSLVEDE